MGQLLRGRRAWERKGEGRGREGARGGEVEGQGIDIA